MNEKNTPENVPYIIHERQIKWAAKIKGRQEQYK